jgi:hypothetical protein
MAESIDSKALSVTVKFECHKNGDTDLPKIQYSAKITFKNLEELLEAGGESVTRKLQTKARKGQFPTGRIVNVNGQGEFTLSVAERAELMDDDEAAALFEALRKRQAAKMAQTNGLVQDEPKTVGVKK